MDKCKGCLCNNCSNACQECPRCANAEQAETDWDDMKVLECESYDS